MIDAFELTIPIDETHFGVVVDDYRLEFDFNSYANKWFLSIWEDDLAICGSIMIVPNIDLIPYFPYAEIVAITKDSIIDRDTFYNAKMIYIPVEIEDEI